MVMFRKAASLGSIATAIMSNGKTSGIWGDSLRYAPSAFIPAATAVLAAGVFTRLFTPSQYGLYGLVLAILAPVATVIGQSVGNGTGRYYIEYRRDGKLTTYRQAVTWLVVVGWLVCASLTGVASLIVGVVVHSTTLLWMVLGAGVLVGIQSTVTMLIPILSSSFQPTYYSLVNGAAALLSFGTALTLVWSLGHHAYWLIWGSVIGQAFIAPILLRRFPLSSVRSIIRLPDEVRRAVIEFVSYGVPMVFWVLSASVMGLADRTLLQVFRGSAAVGIYGINSNMAGQAVGLVIGPFITASWPILMKDWAESGQAAVQKAMTSFTRSYLALSIGIIGVSVVVVKPLESILLGPRFVHGAYLLVPCLIGRVLWGGGRLGHSILKLANRTGTLAMDALAAAAFNVMLTVVLVPSMGMLGAAYSLIPSFALYAGLVWMQSRAVVPWAIDWRHLAGSVFGAVVAIAMATMINAHMPPMNLVRLAAGTAVFGAVYGLCQVALAGGVPKLTLRNKGEPHIG